MGVSNAVEDGSARSAEPKYTVDNLQRTSDRAIGGVRLPGEYLKSFVQELESGTVIGLSTADAERVLQGRSAKRVMDQGSLQAAV